MQNYFWEYEMKNTKTILVLFLLLLFALPRTAFAQGEFLDLSDIGGASDSGFLSGDLVASPQDSGGGDLGSSISDAIFSTGGDLVGDMAGGMVSSAVGGGFLGDMLGDAAGGWVGDLVTDSLGDAFGDSLSGIFNDAISSIPEIRNIQETLEGMASSMQGAIIGPNIPHYRILWMFSGESVINEVKSIFSGNYSNVEAGLENLKQMF